MLSPKICFVMRALYVCNYVCIHLCSAFSVCLLRSYDLLPLLIVMPNHACEVRVPCRSLIVIVSFVCSDGILYIVFVLIYFSGTNLHELL